MTSASLQEQHFLRVQAMGAVLADPQVGQGRTSGELMAILTSDTTAAAQVIRVLAYAVSGIAGLAVTAAVLLRIDLWLGLGILLTVPPLIIGIDRISPWLERTVRARRQAGGLAAALAAELVHALRPLRGFGGMPEAARRYRLASRQSLQTDLDAASAAAVVTGAGLVASGLVVVGTAAAAGAMAFAGRINVGEFVTVVAMASFVADPVTRISSAIEQLAVSRASAARVAPLLPPCPRPAAGPAAAPLGPLAIRSVVIGPVSGLDVTLGPGEILGIVTTSPALGDTVTNLLAGHQSPQSGSVLLGDVPVGAVDPQVIRRHILVEPHHAQLLGTTLQEALDTGRETSPARTSRALKAAGAADAAATLLDGAVNLSGGQRQRVALARALAADPPVLVLRDPLTAVDSVTEDMVAGGLRSLRSAAGRATVIIATSPALLSRCDRVVFIDGAVPPVTGTHADLLATPDYATAVLR